LPRVTPELVPVDVFHRPRPSSVHRDGLSPFSYLRSLEDRKYQQPPWSLFLYSPAIDECNKH
jgi:hypothetical protein